MNASSIVAHLRRPDFRDDIRMPPKKSSVKRAAAARPGKDAESVAETKQQTLDDTQVGQKRDNPIELEAESDDAGAGGGDKRKDKKKDKKNSTDNVTEQDVQAPGRPDGQRATKRQKQEAADKAGLDGPDEIDGKSEQAKAKGREIKEDSNVETRKPARGTLGALLPRARQSPQRWRRRLC